MKYGVLTYSINNIGDDIQTLVAMQYLPQVDYYVDRDKIEHETREMKMIGNAYWNRPRCPENIDMLPISMHLSNHFRSNKNDLSWFKKNEPIGCRDLETKNFLLKNGIEAYFSGCLTLTFPKYKGKRTNEIIVVDEIPEQWKRDIEKYEKDVVYIDHIFDKKDERLQSVESRLKEANDRLERYKRAKLVLTSRLHALLPCIAFGTPVAFYKRTMFGRFKGYNIPEHDRIDLRKNYTIEKPEKLVKDLQDKIRKFIIK